MVPKLLLVNTNSMLFLPGTRREIGVKIPFIQNTSEKQLMEYSYCAEMTYDGCGCVKDFYSYVQITCVYGLYDTQYKGISMRG